MKQLVPGISKYIERINKRIPPAILKSPTLIPSHLKMILPRNTKTIARRAAMATESTKILFFCFSLKDSVNTRKIGTVPIISIAKKIGIKVTKNRFKILKNIVYYYTEKKVKNKKN